MNRKIHGEECTEEEYWKHWDALGVEECEHGHVPPVKLKSGKWAKGGCTKCKTLDLYQKLKLFKRKRYTAKELKEKRAINKILSDPKQRPKFYEYLCNIKFRKIFGVELLKMNIYSYRFDGGSFENYNILIEYKSAEFDGPSNYSNAVHSLLKMMIAELKHRKPVLKVVVFYSKKLAEKFLRNEFKKLEILLSSSGINPNSVQIWWFNGSDEPEKL